MPVQTRTAKKLVLARETLRTLARPRSQIADAVVTSCGEVCTCACDTDAQTF
jgi:hypothetical protein